ATRIWTDPGLSFRASEPMGGLSDDLPGTLHTLFDRFVSSQYQRGQFETITDDQVWSAVRPRLDASIVRALRPKKFETDDFSIEFSDEFGNELGHLVKL